MNGLNTPAINIQMPGLASHISVDNAERISFTQLTTQVHNTLEILGSASMTNCTCSGALTAPNMTSTTATVDTLNTTALNTSAINMPMSGLATHFEVDNTARITFGQLDTTIHGDVAITGNLTSANGGGGTVDLTPYQHHASSHIQALGMESNAQSEKQVGFYTRLCTSL